MNSRQIESWTLRVIDAVKDGQPNEDFLVELKRDWIHEYKAARRIAGHANAARGENILWLIGIDEQEGVTGASSSELADWYPKVESYFNEMSPKMTPLNIPVDGVTVVALLFETDRAPFVVKNPDFGKQKGAIELEVPWRESNKLRTARRSDIVQLLMPLEMIPEVEIISAKLIEIISGQDSLGKVHLDALGNQFRPDALILLLELFFTPRNPTRIVIPFHKCKTELEIGGNLKLESSNIGLVPARRNYGPSNSIFANAQSTDYEILIDGPSRVSLHAISERPASSDFDRNCNVAILVYLFPSNASRPITLEAKIPYPSKRD